MESFQTNLPRWYNGRAHIWGVGIEPTRDVCVLCGVLEQPAFTLLLLLVEQPPIFPQFYSNKECLLEKNTGTYLGSSVQ